MHQRSPHSAKAPISTDPSDPHTSPTPHAPGAADTKVRTLHLVTSTSNVDTDAQMKQLAMLEGTARLRRAEQRVRDGLVSPHIDRQPPAAGGTTASAPRIASRRELPRHDRPGWRRFVVPLGAAAIVLGGLVVAFVR